MPTIAVNLSQVEAYENLPLGEYLAQIDKIVYKPTDDPNKHPQLQVTYSVLEEGALLGKTTSEWLSLSPKAGFRLKKWFAHFGLDETDNFDVDDDTDELLDPDLIGYQVIISVYKERDKRVRDETAPDAYRIRTALVSVEDEAAPAPAPAPKRAAAPAPEPEADDSAEEAEAAPAPRRAARPAQAARPARRTLR